MKNQHFVAFRTWGPIPVASEPLVLSAIRLLACALGWNLPVAKLCSPAPPGDWGGRSPRRWRRAAPSLLLSARKRDALEAMADGLPGDGHRVLPADLAEPGAAEALAAEAGARRRARRQRRAAGGRLARRLQPGGGHPRPAGQPRGSDADRPRALPGHGRSRLGPPRLCLLAVRQGGQPAFIDLQRDQVRPAGVRPRPADRPRAQRSRGLARLPRFHPRRGDVRRRRCQAARRTRDRHARAGRAGGGQVDRARQGRDRRGAHAGTDRDPRGGDQPLDRGARPDRLGGPEGGRRDRRRARANAPQKR